MDPRKFSNETPKKAEKHVEDIARQAFKHVTDARVRGAMAPPAEKKCFCPPELPCEKPTRFPPNTLHKGMFGMFGLVF